MLFAGVRDILQEDFEIQTSLTLLRKRQLRSCSKRSQFGKWNIMQEQYKWDQSGNDIPPRDPPQEVLLIHDPMDDSDEMNKKPAAKETEGKGRV